MRYFIKIFTFILLTAFAFESTAQIGSCNAAQNACSNPGFSLTAGGGTGLSGNLNVSNPSTNPQTGTGTNPSATFRNSGCLFSNGTGPNWMIITVSSSGMLGFSFGAGPAGTPCRQTGFYDWAMWPYDANTCTNIFNNTLPPAACNWNASSSGGTGMGTPPAGGTAGNYQPSIPVTAGQQFIILLSNFSSVNSCVNISSTGSAGMSCSPLILPSAIRCPGQQAVISGTWAANVTNQSFTITSAMPLNTSTYTIQTNPTFIVAPTATQVYTVFAAGVNTLNSVVTSSNTFTVTISPTTTMNLISPNPNSVCYGSPATIQADLGGTNYTLTGPPNTPTIVAATPIITTPTLGTSGNYTISTTLFSGCTATVSSAVSVAPNHSITINAPLNLCLNATASLTASFPVGATFLWKYPNGSTTSVQNPTVAATLAAAGVYTVIATFNYGGVPGNTVSCSKTATTSITVVNTSPVSVSGLSSQVKCQGDNLFLASSLNSGSASAYLWSGPSGFNASAQNATVSSLMPNNTGVYTVTAIFTNPYVSCFTTSTVNVHVIATAVPTISLPRSICEKDTAHLLASASATPTGYSWTGPNSFSSASSNTNIPYIQPSASGTYIATAYFTYGGLTCQKQATGIIDVIPVNTVTIIPPAPVCEPNDVHLNASSVGALTYSWAGPNNFVGHQSNSVVFHPSVNASGIYTVTVSFGGAALVCYNSNTVQVNVNPNLTFDLSANELNTNLVVADGGVVCYDTPIRFNGPAGATSYSWSSSTGLTGSSQFLNINSAQASDQGTYTLSVSLGACVTTRSMYIRVVGHIAQVHAQPDIIVCRGDTVTLREQIAGGSGTIEEPNQNYSYEWTPPLYLNAPHGSIQHTKPLLGTTIYSVKMKDVVCPAFFLTHSFKVTVLENPKPSLVLEKDYGCQPLNLFLDSKVANSSAIVTYDFYGSDGSSRRIQADSFHYSLTEAATYMLRIKTTKLYESFNRICSDSTEYPAPIVVYPKPGSDITWLPEFPTMSENNVTFFASAGNGVVQTRNWLFSGTYNDTINSASPQRVFEYTGKYPVVLTTTNEFGCTDTVVKFIEVRDDFNVFIPNSFTPNGDNLNDQFQLKGSGIKETSFSMEIYDRWGNSMFYTKDPAKGWDGTVKGQQQAGEGVYVYKIKLSGANGEGRKEYIGQLTLIR